MPEDDLSQASRDSALPAFDFDDDAIATLLDAFVETQTGPQSKHVSRPADPNDAGAQVAQRTVFQRIRRHDALPLVGDSVEARKRRIVLLDTLTEQAVGSARSRLMTSAAELCDQLGDAEGAVFRYGQALAADARDVIVLRALRRHAIRRRDWPAAAAALEKEAALDIATSERAAALRMLATILLYKLGDPAAAEQAATRAAELQADDFVACALIVSACLVRNEHRRAAETLARAAERWPVPSAQAVVLLHAAELMERARAPEAAKTLFERVVDLEPESLAARLGLVRAARALGERSRAIDELCAAAEHESAPVAQALRRSAAVIHHAMGNDADAMALLDRATNASSRWTLAEIASLSGDSTRAREALEADATDDTEVLAALRSTRRARIHAEANDEAALGAAVLEAQALPDLVPYLRALRRLCASEEPSNGALRRLLETVPRDDASPAAKMANADRAARVSDVPTLLRTLKQEIEHVPESCRVGAFLAVAEASGALGSAERLAALLDTERRSPGNPLLSRALMIVDGDARRNAGRWKAEGEAADGARSAFAFMMAYRAMPSIDALRPACESALRRQPDYWPALWKLESEDSSRDVRADAARKQAELDPQNRASHLLRASLWTGSPADRAAHAHAALDWNAPDSLLVEHLIDLSGSASADAGGLMRLAASKLGEPSYLQRAADAYRASGLPAVAARLLRDAEAAMPDDVGIRARRKDAQLEAGEFARLADAAMERAKAAESQEDELAALCAMSEMDRLARGDMQSARLSLQSIAEMRPDHIPTARALEWDALREEDTERIRSGARRLIDALERGCADGLARRRLIVELLKADSDILQTDIDHALRAIEDRPDADPGLARQLLGAAYAKNDGVLCLGALRALGTSLTEELERGALALEEARVLRELGDTDEALETLRHSRSHPLAVEEEARLLQAAARWEAAASAYEEAASRARDHQRAASLWREAALLFEDKLADDTRATRAWMAAANADITYLDVYRRLADQYRSSGQDDELVSLTQARIDAGADTPTLVTLLLEQAAQRRERGDAEGVVDALHECLELDPHHFAALAQLVDAHRHAENYQGAAEALIRIARLKRSTDEQAWAFSQLGEIYHEHLGDLERAEASLRRARELAPGHTETLDRLASVLTLRGNALESARLLEALVRRAADDAQRRDYRIRLAGAVEQAGQARQAELVLERLRADQPTDPDVILAVADFYERQGDSPAGAMHLNRALNDLRTALEAEPGDEALWITLVRVLHRRHGPGPASCAASAAIAIGHPASLFEGDVTARHEALGEPEVPLRPAIHAVVAPPGLPPTLRRLFTLCEHSFDKVLPFDAAAWRLRKPSSEHRSLVEEAGAVAQAMGISEPRLKVTYVAPSACIPISGDPPTLVIGGHLHETTTPQERVFLFARALEVAANHLAPALRARPGELDAALVALLHGHEEARQGLDPRQNQELRRKLLKAVPRRWRDEVESLVLELRGNPSFSARSAPFAISELGDRVALTLTGDVPSAVDALLKMAGKTVPPNDAGRLGAIREVPEAWAIIRFAISDAHFEARAQAGVDL
ncbi:MAG: hypothetical protein AMJ62_03070 [Myxococcales bacterium SG8_38]|nr:MAG: hypothetical protein AMJ62_03070 [Myxococcales bacterium SG8_38]